MMIRQAIALALVLIFSAVTAFAGGPLYVAGISGFNSSATGQPITWRGGVVNYYTDQGNLSPLLPATSADSFVATAFASWSSVTTAALQINHAGQLSEDVSGSNVQNAGSLILPVDIQPNSPMSIAVIYDYDGSVVDAFLGTGAGSEDLCDSNSVISTADNFTADGHFAHALVIINGNCAQYATDLPILQYRLARQLGRVLGLDWSQVNDNVVTGSPPPKMDDYAGYPMMHPMGALCFPTYGCTSNPLQTRMDDQAAISRLYPVTSANFGNFPGKTLFVENTARIEGSVRFPAWNGNPGQGMQGVNVVARMIDPVTGLPSHKYTASCVSGFLFRGDAGNPITGYTDNSGEPLDRFGSNNRAVEGYFDLAGLQFPAGSSTVQYQLSVESVNSLYNDALAVGPYKQGSIPMSGTFTPITVTVSKGSDVNQDLVMQGAPSQPQDQWEPSTFAQPAEIPGGGNWIGSLSGYGDTDYYHLHARANRSFSFSVTALNENGSPTVTKAQPAMGVWQSTDPETAPSLSQSAFGTSMQVGVTQLSADINLEGDYKLGIADMRGDGRPDFSYAAHVLYADAISPARASVHTTTPVTITGFGFTPTTTVMVGTNAATVTSQQAGQLVISAPPLSDSTQTIYLKDNATGLIAEMDNVLNYGTINGTLTLLQGMNPRVPAGTQAPNPVRVLVTESDGVTPIPDAAVTFVASAGIVFTACGNSNCTIFTDSNGVADAYMLLTAAGTFTITASISTGASVQASVIGTANALSISLPVGQAWGSPDSSGSIPLSAIAIANGQPLPGTTVNFQVAWGTATLSAASSVTDGTGTANTQVNINHLTSDVIVNACLAPDNTVCRIFTISYVPAAYLQLSKIAGDNQTITIGQSFSAIRVRVTDSSSTPNPVAAVPVQFLVTAFRAPVETPTRWNGESGTKNPGQPVVLSSSVSTQTSDATGYVSLPISFPAQWGPLMVSVQATANVSQTFTLQSTW
jgi:Bacterial Ig-like domain (group 1)/IPT/TIG domain